MPKVFAKIAGALFLLLSGIGFFMPEQSTMNELLSLTGTHHILHLVTGAIFLAVSWNDVYSKSVSLYLGASYGMLAILGLFIQDLYGVISVAKTVEIFHLVTAAASLYVGLYRQKKSRKEIEKERRLKDQKLKQRKWVS